jgi:hypothetical protein
VKKQHFVVAGSQRIGLIGKFNTQFIVLYSLLIDCKIPYTNSDGTHGEHNKECSDNIGPVVLQRKKN